MRKSNFLLHFLSVLLALPFLMFSLRITPVAGQPVDEQALPNYRLYFLESNENLTILSETVTLDIVGILCFPCFQLLAGYGRRSP